MSLPNPIIQVLQHFRPAFTRPTWDKALVLVVGTLLARGRRTVTAALKQMGLHDEVDFTLFHQVLNRASWSCLGLSRLLLQLLVGTFLEAGGTVEIVIDETLERRWGMSVAGANLQTWALSRQPAIEQRAICFNQWSAMGSDDAGSASALDT